MSLLSFFGDFASLPPLLRFFQSCVCSSAWDWVIKKELGKEEEEEEDESISFWPRVQKSVKRGEGRGFCVSLERSLVRKSVQNECMLAGITTLYVTNGKKQSKIAVTDSLIRPLPLLSDPNLCGLLLMTLPTMVCLPPYITGAARVGLNVGDRNLNSSFPLSRAEAKRANKRLAKSESKSPTPLHRI